jgi:hypothetical protein
MTLRTFVEADCPQPPDRTFAHILLPTTIPDAVHGAGPIPRVVRTEMLGSGRMAVGAARRVHAADGTSVLETVVEIAAPSRHRYVLSEFGRPFAWLVRSGEALWTLTPREGGTHVRWDYSFTLTTPLAWPVVALLLRLWFRRAIGEALARVLAGIPRG